MNLSPELQELLATAANIPGMIEPAEMIVLHKLASSIEIGDKEQIVEFGTFFGRSSYCIAEGLRQNPTLKTCSSLQLYDLLSCSESEHGFAPYVLNFAKRGGVDKLVRSSQKRIFFEDVLRHYIGRHIESGLVTINQCSIRNSVPRDGTIALIHLDSPKHWRDFRYIWHRFFPLLRNGSKVVFQDFFYHWSGGLIAGAQLLMRHGILSPVESAATTLVCTVNRAIDSKLLIEMDLQMDEKDRWPSLIDECIGTVRDACKDRPNYFLGRLLLAKVQLLYFTNRHHEASRIIESFLASSGTTRDAFKLLSADLVEMIQKGFSIEGSYELDYDA